MSTQTQNTPPQPAYIFRGHTSQIHALHFYYQQTTTSSPVLTLASGDASGFIILWSLITKRPLAVWKAHDASILAIHFLSPDKLISHARDSKIIIWHLPSVSLSTLSQTLPSTDPSPPSTHPLPPPAKIIQVSTINFCGISLYQPTPTTLNATPPQSYTIASPSAQDGFISLLHMRPTTNSTSAESQEEGGGGVAGGEERELIPCPRDVKVGMVMSVKLVPDAPVRGGMRVVVGYESGHVAVWKKDGGEMGRWGLGFIRKVHSQPVLSVDGILGAGTGEEGVVFSSGADGILGRYVLGEGGQVEVESRQTRHAGQQGLVVRGDERVFATAGWDGRVRVYDTAKGMAELAVLKWHKEGCYAAAFADVSSRGDEGDGAVVKRELSVAQRRTEKAHSTHWLAAGSKDGKISLWDIF